MELRMWTDNDGDYVLYEDFVALREENANLKEELQSWTLSRDGVMSHIEELGLKIHQLKEAKRELVEALERCIPIVIIEAQANHWLDGFKKQRRIQDDLVDDLHAAIAKHKEG